MPKRTPIIKFSLVAANVALLASLCFLYLHIGLDTADKVTAATIVTRLRLPRMLCAMGVGTLLSVSGAMMQGLFRNPLVEPYTMGVSGGAIVGVALTFVCGAVAAWGSWTVVAGAAVGALAAMCAALLMRRAAGHDTGVMLLCGITVSFVSSAVTTVALAIATREDMSQILSWTIGSFENVDDRIATLTAAVGLVAALSSPLCGNTLNVLSLGDGEAETLGIDIGKATTAIFVAATLLTALSVSAAGVVAFVGMAVPHMTRTIVGHDHRISLPLSGLMGATLMLGCDLLAKTLISPRELPAGAICAVLGGLMFTYITVRWKRTGA